MQLQTPSTLSVRRTAAALLSDGWALVRAGGARLAGLILVSQLAIMGVALPVIGWLFREALRAGGMTGLDLGALDPQRSFTLTIALIVAIVILAFWLISMQFTALLVMLQWPGIGLRGFARELGRVARKLLRPGSLSLLLYLFLLLPLTGFGFTSAFTRGIAIPSFISGELLKSTSGGVALTVLLVALALLNVRLALTVPIFVLTSGGRAARWSWRLTRGPRASLPLVLSIAAVLLLGGVAAIALTITAMVPVALSDTIAPTASPVVAAYSLGTAQVIGILLSGLVTAFVGAILIARVRSASQNDPLFPPLATPPAGAPHHRGMPDRSSRPSRRPALLVGSLMILTAIGFGTAAIDTLQRLSDVPDTLALAHRGFSDGGVENTISGLEAAHAAGADLVEMDVMQTRDGEFVAMHDATLGRLAGRSDSVKDLTLAELTAITVHDMRGHEDLIPSFADYVTRAQQLGMPLLIEIKLGGGETPDHVERLVDELERLDALKSNIYHSLDAPSVDRLKRLRPDLTVGYTMAFAAVAAPNTPADFIVPEEWSATDELQRSAEEAGLGFMVWTVNDEPGMRELLRRGVDGIISDHPDEVLELRAGMQQETGLTDVLIDALARFVTVV
ncbi:glycerophosphodiester phosphodiesterase family protein [Leucobacter tenebrionis]|uniref:glycerophosphodiester phosphodiesterase family protein n=1 Tax=Leucobacter tenebrionis TaxID=2873270 RepID=UPI001CA79E4D|nr:glycerophosphodiester phosphodiesterase family protein [Leucobacter tenebrionis]QZY53151.1 glycerophosphoryl diester phosphodiesterase membrane domain-containing protein [Leucobacter tenebrionis]